MRCHMSNGSLVLLFALTITATAQAAFSPQPKTRDWDVQSIVRTLDLGAITGLTDVHVIRPPDSTSDAASEEDVKPYYFALAPEEAQHISGLEATARYGPGITAEQRAILKVEDKGLLPLDTLLFGANASTTRPHLFSVRLPLHFLQRKTGEERIPDLTLTITGMLVHAARPLPKSVAQTESQYLLWQGSAAPLTVYGADSARIKARTPQQTILSYSTEPELPSDQLTKSGQTVTFGPYQKLPSILDEAQDPSTAVTARIHFLYDSSVLTIVEAKREAKISHWRNRVQFEDRLWIKNEGAELKGHFSRVEHQMGQMTRRTKGHTITEVAMHLPPGADGAYFIDESGNVSTSHFRPARPSPSHVSTPAYLLSESRASLLQLRPRYPLLGGWNYTFSVGWNVKLSDGWLKEVTKQSDRYSVHVPFTTSLKGVAVDDAELRVILPEGAKDIKYEVPFDVDVKEQKSWSFLDTTGKTVIWLQKRRCSERHGGMVQIEYTLTALDHYRKVLIAALVVGGTGILLRLVVSIDLRLKA